MLSLSRRGQVKKKKKKKGASAHPLWKKLSQFLFWKGEYICYCHLHNEGFRKELSFKIGFKTNFKKSFSSVKLIFNKRCPTHALNGEDLNKRGYFNIISRVHVYLTWRKENSMAYSCLEPLGYVNTYHFTKLRMLCCGISSGLLTGDDVCPQALRVKRKGLVLTQ